MRIAYVARHGVHGNCDERAVGLALEELGHEVVRLSESEGDKVNGLTPDLVLFHKWRPTHELLRSIRAPKVFYYWDLVSWPGDKSLAGRNAHRIAWMRHVVPFVDCGFLTDGDYVDSKGSRNLCWLPQGFDGTFKHPPDVGLPLGPDVLLTGISKGGGRDRESFVAEMHEAYGRRFKHITKGVHREQLYREVRNAKVVVAPDSPVTDRYWSNRVYLMTGMGGFLLHPYCKRLYDQYHDGDEVVFYRNRMELHSLVGYYLDRPQVRADIAARGMAKTMAQHTYRHRLEQMFRVLKDRRIL